MKSGALPEKYGFCNLGNDSAQGFWQLFLQLCLQSDQSQALLMWLQSALSFLCQNPGQMAAKEFWCIVPL